MRQQARAEHGGKSIKRSFFIAIFGALFPPNESKQRAATQPKRTAAEVVDKGIELLTVLKQPTSLAPALIHL